MPMMPTFEVTDAQATRLLAVYGSVEGYKQWLVREVIEEVLKREAQARVRAFQEQERAAREAARAEFGLDSGG